MVWADGSETRPYTLGYTGGGKEPPLNLIMDILAGAAVSGKMDVTDCMKSLLIN